MLILILESLSILVNSMISDNLCNLSLAILYDWELNRSLMLSFYLVYLWTIRLKIRSQGCSILGFRPLLKNILMKCFSVIFQDLLCEQLDHTRLWPFLIFYFEVFATHAWNFRFDLFIYQRKSSWSLDVLVSRT